MRASLCLLPRSRQLTASVTAACSRTAPALLPARRLMASAPRAAASAGAAPAAAAPPVLLFTTAGCPYCKRAKEALAAASYVYTEVDVSGDAALRAALADATGRKTVPQVGALLSSAVPYFDSSVLSIAEECVKLSSFLRARCCQLLPTGL